MSVLCFSLAQVGACVVGQATSASAILHNLGPTPNSASCAIPEAVGETFIARSQGRLAGSGLSTRCTRHHRGRECEPALFNLAAKGLVTKGHSRFLNQSNKRCLTSFRTRVALHHVFLFLVRSIFGFPLFALVTKLVHFTRRNFTVLLSSCL